jgi:predicted permease
MDRLAALVSWARGVFFRRAAEAEMDEELRFHIEMETEHNLRSGMSPQEAHRRALVAFGGVDRHRERLREGRRLPLLETLWQDLRFGLRSLVRDPWLSAVAVLVVALGVGATTSVLSVVDAILVRPLPIPAAERVGSIQEYRDGPVSTMLIPYPRFEAYRAATTEVFEDLAGYRPNTFSVQLSDVTVAAEGGLTSGDFFATLAVRPQLGRAYTTDDAAEAVVSHDFWVSRLGSDPAVIGSVVRVDGHPVTIVGIAPTGFRGPTIVADAIWLPIGIRGLDAESWSMRVVPIGRLGTDVTRERAAAVVDAAAHSIAAEPGATVHRASFESMTAVPGWARGDVGTFLGMLLGMAVLVLLIASGNVSGVLLARSVARQREVAVRLAIGAGRSRLVRHLLAESLLIFAVATAGGIAFAYTGTAWLARLPIPPQFGIVLDLAPDPRVLGIAVALTLGTGLIFGLVPALRGSRPELLAALKLGGSGSIGGGGRAQSILVAGQVGLTVLLLLTATLFARSFQKGLARDPGFDPDGVVVARMSLSGAYDETRHRAFFEELTERVRALPGVEATGLAQYVFLAGTKSGTSVRRPEAPDVATYALLNNVDPDFFGTLGIDLVAGRTFTDQDVEGSTPVAVINQTLAERLWPGSSPLGQRLRGMLAEDREVVGVVANGRYGTITEAPQSYAYAPIAQWGPTALAVHARAPGAEAMTLRAIQTIVRELDPDVALELPGPLGEFVGTGLLPHRYAAQLVGLFGLIGLLLAATGIYGMLAFHVTQRTRELGLRRALGAGRNHLARVVLGRAAWLVAGGALVGLLLGGGVGSIMRSFLVELSPLDPVTFVSVPVVLALVALLACWRPVARALAIEPSEALRQE